MIGEIYTNSKGYRAIVIDELSGEVIVEFLEGVPCKGVFRKKDIRDGLFSYPFAKNVFNIGYVGYGPYLAWDRTAKKNTTAYKTWYSMLSRCYDENTKNNAYTNVAVCKDWHNFQVFAEWFYKQYQEGYHLDKDLLQVGRLQKE